MTTLNITSHNVPFTIRLVAQGDKVGLKGDLTHEKPEPLVEFYDKRYPHSQYGQFIGSYYLSTMLDSTKGFNLDGGVPDWNVREPEMNTVRQWLNEQPLTKQILSSGLPLMEATVKKMRFK